MELLEAIYQRRTIKDFKPGEVPDAVIEEVLATGLWAQNHKLTQPWRFALLGRETRQALAERFAEVQASQSGADAGGSEGIKAASGRLAIAAARGLRGDFLRAPEHPARRVGARGGDAMEQRQNYPDAADVRFARD